MSNDDVVYHSPERSVPNEPAHNDHSPILTHPTFNLLSQSPSQPQLLQQKQPPPPETLSSTTPATAFTAATSYQLRLSAQRHQQPPLSAVRHQPPLSAVQHQPPLSVAHQPPPLSAVQQPPPAVQQQPALVQQQPPAPQQYMQLRERRDRHTNCGTAGKKVPDCKRLRYKY